MTGSQQDTTSSLTHTDHIASGRGAQDTVLADQQLLHAVGSADLRDQLDDLGVVVTAITTNDQEGALSTLRDGKEDASDEGFGVVGLLEDGDLLTETRTGRERRQHCP